MYCTIKNGGGGGRGGEVLRYLYIQRALQVEKKTERGKGWAYVNTQPSQVLEKKEKEKNKHILCAPSAV